MSIATETETVVKKILPYLVRRGYEVEKDLDFETAVKTTDRYSKGYVDILVTCGKAKPIFLIEAKRLAKKLSQKDRDQAVEYVISVHPAFVGLRRGKQRLSAVKCTSPRPSPRRGEGEFILRSLRSLRLD